MVKKMTENMDENGKEEIDCREEKLNYSNKEQGKTKKIRKKKNEKLRKRKKGGKNSK